VSKKGVTLMSEVFNVLQQTRHELMKMGTKWPINKQDLLLAQLCEDAKESVKGKFLSALEEEK
jgi:hypothetical protein